MITGTKPFPFTVVYGETKLLLDPSLQNTRQGESILFGKARLLEVMAIPEAYGFRVKYMKSESDTYSGIQVVMVAVNKAGVPILDIAQAAIDDPLAHHGGIFGIGYPNQPEPQYFILCCIDWVALYIAIYEAMKDEPIEWPDLDDDYDPDDPLPPGGFP